MNNKRTRRTYEDIFIDRLAKMLEPGQTSVGSQNLQTELNWDEKRYKRIKASLVKKNKIVLGPGRGGTVGLTPTSDNSGLSVFISYCHKDSGLMDKLVRHLRPLERLNLIKKVWHDGRIDAGEEWEPSIRAALAEADIILLLVSIDFINSNFCFEIELKEAIERHRNNKAIVVPIILRSCLWEQMPFGAIQALPPKAKAVDTWSNEDEAFTAVAKGIFDVAKKIRDNAI